VKVTSAVFRKVSEFEKISGVQSEDFPPLLSFSLNFSVDFSL
jgi:hypothetical protein